MGVSVPILVISISLHLIAFVLAVGAERRRSTVPFCSISLTFFCLFPWNFLAAFNCQFFSLVKAKVVPDEYDEKTYCAYGTDASTVYGLSAFGLLLISQALIHGVTKCLCFGRGMMGGSSTTGAIVFFIFSWYAYCLLLVQLVYLPFLPIVTFLLL